MIQRVSELTAKIQITWMSQLNMIWKCFRMFRAKRFQKQIMKTYIIVLENVKTIMLTITFLPHQK